MGCNCGLNLVNIPKSVVKDKNDKKDKDDKVKKTKSKQTELLKKKALKTKMNN